MAGVQRTDETQSLHSQKSYLIMQVYGICLIRIMFQRLAFVFVSNAMFAIKDQVVILKNIFITVTLFVVCGYLSILV